MSRPKSIKASDDRVLVGVEVAALIGRSMATLYKMIRDGRLPQPRQLGPHRAIWLRNEVIDALRRLPVKRKGKGSKAKGKV